MQLNVRDCAVYSVCENNFDKYRINIEQNTLNISFYNAFPLG